MERLPLSLKLLTQDAISLATIEDVKVVEVAKWDPRTDLILVNLDLIRWISNQWKVSPRILDIFATDHDIRHKPWRVLTALIDVFNKNSLNINVIQSLDEDWIKEKPEQIKRIMLLNAIEQKMILQSITPLLEAQQALRLTHIPHKEQYNFVATKVISSLLSNPIVSEFYEALKSVYRVCDSSVAYMFANMLVALSLDYPIEDIEKLTKTVGLSVYLEEKFPLEFDPQYRFWKFLDAFLQIYSERPSYWLSAFENESVLHELFLEIQERSGFRQSLIKGPGRIPLANSDLSLVVPIEKVLPYAKIYKLFCKLDDLKVNIEELEFPSLSAILGIINNGEFKMMPNPHLTSDEKLILGKFLGMTALAHQVLNEIEPSCLLCELNICPNGFCILKPYVDRARRLYDIFTRYEIPSLEPQWKKLSVARVI
jgi:hypothetical protein